ncbi:MAG: aminoglycoside phosphotransferase family protein [Ferruginibacter sp.]
MKQETINKILLKYGFNPDEIKCVPFGNGLINHTWKLTSGENHFILQSLNTNIFKNPNHIADNISLIGNYLSEHQPGYFFVRPIKSGKEMLEVDGSFFRLFPFVENSHTVDVATKPQQAYEAASQFARFSKVLSALDPGQLYITLADFHNLSLRYAQFEKALQDAGKERLAQSQELISIIQQHKNIVTEFESIKQDPAFRIRITHHDTKISNVLFDENNKGICVIDLDTVMPGYFISDVGDMMRTYLSPAGEEETNFSLIEIRSSFYHAIADGYLSEMKDELSATEKKYFLFAGKFMVYMQAIRFLTDHLNNDIYYGAKYEGHNFIRAGNQLFLLERLINFENQL